MSKLVSDNSGGSFCGKVRSGKDFDGRTRTKGPAARGSRRGRGLSPTISGNGVSYGSTIGIGSNRISCRSPIGIRSNGVSCRSTIGIWVTNGVSYRSTIGIWVTDWVSYRSTIRIWVLGLGWGLGSSIITWRGSWWRSWGTIIIVVWSLRSSGRNWRSLASSIATT